MRFSSTVEPPEPMRGLEVPAEVVEGLGGGRRPRVTVTINGHAWSTRIAIMRGRNLIGLSKANREAAGVATGDAVDVELALDLSPAAVVEPEELTRALDADPAARAAYDRLSHSRRRAFAHAIDSARKPETRARRIEQTLAELRDA